MLAWQCRYHLFSTCTEASSIFVFLVALFSIYAVALRQFLQQDFIGCSVRPVYVYNPIFSRYLVIKNSQPIYNCSRISTGSRFVLFMWWSCLVTWRHQWIFRVISRFEIADGYPYRRRDLTGMMAERCMTCNTSTHHRLSSVIPAHDRTYRCYVQVTHLPKPPIIGYERTNERTVLIQEQSSYKRKNEDRRTDRDRGETNNQITYTNSYYYYQ